MNKKRPLEFTEEFEDELEDEVDALRWQADDSEYRNEGWRIFFGLVISVITLLYLFPFGVSMMRNSHNKLSIFLFNALLGWTFVGWIIALIWAAKSRS